MAEKHTGSEADDDTCCPLVDRAYDDSMVKTVSVPGSRPVGRVSRPIRWSLWLAAGIVFGLVMGFAAGLAKPHVRR